MAIVDGLIDLADAKASLNIATAVTGDDTLIERYVEAATGPIERIAGPIIARSRTFTFDGGKGAYSLPVKIRTVTSVTVDGTARTDYVADLGAGIIYPGSTACVTPYNYGVRNVVIVVAVGIASAADYPANVKLMARELVRHWYQQGHQGNRPSFGNEATDNPSMVFGVPTRRLEELMGESQGLAGFA